MKKFFKVLSIALWLWNVGAHAQIGIVDNNPDKSAALDIK
jgi:hypothetical protein